MANPAPPIETDLEAVTAALAGVQPRPGRVLLFGSRARGDARPDSDFDLLVVMPPGQAHPVGTATGVAFAAGGAAPPAVVGWRRSCRGGRRGCPASGWLPLACGGAGPARGEGTASGQPQVKPLISDSQNQPVQSSKEQINQISQTACLCLVSF